MKIAIDYTSNLINFLGGIYFAILLLISLVLFVITGTVIESYTKSHSIAAQFTYNSSLFNALLAGLFINIFVSALRRYPWQRRHIPFLLVHLGLLMILSGVITKNIFGIQGTISLLEGSTKNYLETSELPSYPQNLQRLVYRLPFKITLKEARQINYPDSNQPFSYEADLRIIEHATSTAIDATISMNNVHETWSGYRFYLSNIGPGDKSQVQRVQLIINQDPLKYILTYPGCIIMTIGIILLLLKTRYA